MKILDRYVIISFIKNYLISFMVLVGMYVVLDMIFNFDELMEIQDQAGVSGLKLVFIFIRYVGEYYVYQIPLYYVHLSGMIPVVAAAFTIVRMTRFNELSAVLSAGVPLLRVVTPIIIVALLLQGLLWVDQELIIPNIIPRLEMQRDRLIKAEIKPYKIEAMRDDSNGKLIATLYHRGETPPRMAVVDIVHRDENFRPISHISADAALWDDAYQQWNLVNGRIDRNLAPGSPNPLLSEPVAVYKSNITPTEIHLYRSGEFVELLSTANINELLKRPLSYGRGDLLRVKHTRAAAIIVNIILLLLAMSCLLTREPQHLKMAMGRCVMLCGTCLSFAFLGHELAGQPPPGIDSAHWPALMAWLPIFTFGPLSVWMLDRVKT